MRFLVGLIFGIALTIAVAWVVDHVDLGGSGSRLVNWDQVDKTVDDVRQRVRRLAE